MNAEGEQRETILPVPENASVGERAVLLGARMALMEDGAEEQIMNTIESAQTPAIGVSQVTSVIINEVIGALEGAVDASTLGGDGGVIELIVAQVWKMAEDAGVPGTEEPAEYDAAVEATENLVLAGVAGQAPTDAQAGMPPAAPEQAPPQTDAGWRVPA
jgi:hypothetical protein